ncbi:hypothetical protein Tco_0011686 [Tanacetum coccineum]
MIHLSQEVLDLEKEKDAQAVEILKLKQRVKKLERKRKSSISHPRRRIYRQVESFLDDILDEEDASKQGRTRDQPTAMFIEKGVAIKDVEDSSRPVRSITTLQPLPTINPKNKGKGVLVEEEPEKPVKVKRKVGTLTQKERTKAKKRRATSAALAEEFDEIQARIDANHELAVRLIHEEQEKYTIEERARLLAEFFVRRRNILAAERRKERANRKLDEDNDADKEELRDYNDDDDLIVHVLLMNTGVTIHMMIEKKYPLTQEMLSRMLNRRLEVDYESEMAFELLRFNKNHKLKSRKSVLDKPPVIKMLDTKKLDN